MTSVTETKVKTVKIKALRDLMLGGCLRQIGWCGEVSELEAREFCTPITGIYTHLGVNIADSIGSIARAERI